MDINLKKYKLSYKEASDYVSFIITRSFVSKGSQVVFDALKHETAKILAFLHFYTDFDITAENGYEQYRDLDVETLQRNLFGKEQYKTIMTAVDRQLEYELELLYRSPEHCKTTLSAKEGTDE